VQISVQVWLADRRPDNTPINTPSYRVAAGSECHPPVQEAMTSPCDQPTETPRTTSCISSHKNRWKPVLYLALPGR
jgi:hypothetical protein